jgi:predicted  nucleic acid-binding Zn-ribbon protein
LKVKLKNAQQKKGRRNLEALANEKKKLRNQVSALQSRLKKK